MAHNNPHSIALPDPLLADWRRALLALGKPGKGIPRSAPDDEKIHYIVKNARNDLLELWEAYNTQRDDLGRLPLTHKSRILSYLIGFHLPGAARFSLIWKRLCERYDLDGLKQQPWIAHDLGCGTGAMSHALHYGADHDIHWRLSDARGGFLDTARVVLSELEELRTFKSVIETLKPDYFKAPAEQTSIYLAGYLWNEMQKNPKALKTFFSVLTGPVSRDESCLIFILEPANERPAKLAMELRDNLASAGLIPLYPCPHSAPCPMRETPRDRCYSDAGWSRPPEVKQIDRMLEIDRTRMSTSGYVFASPRAFAQMKPRQKIRDVTVGLPVIGKGGPGDKRTRILCTTEGKLGRVPYQQGGPRDRGLPLDR